MSQRLRKTSIEVKRLSPAEAEIWILAEVDNPAASAELRGQLEGPRCPGVTTLEVAFPMRGLPWSEKFLKARIVIPEPNLWTAEMPFVYQGHVELWEGGECVDRAAITVGLKIANRA